MRKCVNLPALPRAPTADLADAATHPINPRISFSRFGAGFTSADAILPKGHTALTHVLDSSDQSHSATVTIQSAAGINRN